jgi:hypothetical protein
MGGSDPKQPDSGTGDPVPCPSRITVILQDPGGLAPGKALGVTLEVGPPPRVALLTMAGTRLGYAAGVPNLKRLIECIQSGVAYAAHIDKVDAGALHCTLLREPG